MKKLVSTWDAEKGFRKSKSDLKEEEKNSSRRSMSMTIAEIFFSTLGGDAAIRDRFQNFENFTS